MKLTLQKIRLVLIVLILINWTLFGISSIPFGWSYVNWRVVPFMFLGCVLMIFRKRVFDLISLILYLYGVIWVADNYIYHCNNLEFKTFETCRDYVSRLLSIDWIEANCLMLSVFTIVFLIISLFKKQSLEFK